MKASVALQFARLAEISSSNSNQTVGSILTYSLRFAPDPNHNHWEYIPSGHSLLRHMLAAKGLSDPSIIR